MKINNRQILGKKRVTAVALIAALMVLTLIPTTIVAASETPVDLGLAGNFVVLAKAGITTTGATSIVGDIGVSPIASTSMTGFGLILDSSGQFATSSLVTGKVYAADYADPTPAIMTASILDMETAYADALGRPAGVGDFLNVGGGILSGLTLAPGVYTWGSTVTITGDIVLDGSSTDVWIFQIAGTLDISSGKKVLLSGGAQAENIFWQVSGQTTLGTYSVFKGNILGFTGIALQTGATLNGRALAQTAVTLDTNTITAYVNAPPDCSGVKAEQGVLWPPNHKMVKIQLTGAADTVMINVTAVRQDEPTEGIGDGNVSPDAKIYPTYVELRAERSGTGDGRVYHIYFTATDDSGGYYEGEVTVGVPHSVKKAAVDGGALYDSTLP